MLTRARSCRYRYRYAMTEDMFKAVLAKAGCEPGEDGGSALPDGHTMTLYAGHAGNSLVVGHIVSLDLDDTLLEARDNKGERYLLSLEDVYAASVTGGTKTAQARKAGFLGS